MRVGGALAPARGRGPQQTAGRSGPGRAHGRCVAFTRAVPFALRPQTMASVASPLWSPRNGDPGRSRPQSARAAPWASCHSLLGPQRSFLNLTQALRLLLKAPSDRVCKEAVSFWASVRRGVGANQVDGSLPPAWQGHMPRQQHPAAHSMVTGTGGRVTAWSGVDGIRAAPELRRGDSHLSIRSPREAGSAPHWLEQSPVPHLLGAQRGGLRKVGLLPLEDKSAPCAA